MAAAEDEEEVWDRRRAFIYPKPRFALLQLLTPTLPQKGAWRGPPVEINPLLFWGGKGGIAGVFACLSNWAVSGGCGLAGYVRREVGVGSGGSGGGQGEFGHGRTPTSTPTSQLSTYAATRTPPDGTPRADTGPRISSTSCELPLTIERREPTPGSRGLKAHTHYCPIPKFAAQRKNPQLGQSPQKWQADKSTEANAGRSPDDEIKEGLFPG